jgi:hypothetical protein
MDSTENVGVQRPAAARWGSAARILLLIGLLAGLAMVPANLGVPRTAPPAEPEAQPRSDPEPQLFPASDLIYRVPPAIRSSCVPLDQGDLPLETLECSEGLSRALYSRFSSVAEMDAFFDEATGPLNLPVISGGCRAGIPSRDEWHYTHSPARIEGRMACWLLADDAPFTLLTQPEQRLMSGVISNPVLGWPGHHQAWSVRVPNPPPERQPPRRAGGAG